MWAYHNPVDLQFGAGRFAEVAALLSGRRYALISYPDAFCDALSKQLAAAAGPPVLSIRDIAPNPDMKLLGEQTARFAGLAEEPEVILALGGGSVIDSAKVFAAARGDFGRVAAYLQKRTGPETLAPLPLIAVPTTAGTGSEVTSWATVWDVEAGRKYSLAHPGLHPEIALIDPDLMLGKPRALTIQTGLDALSHALESLWNVSANPVSMVHAVAAAREIIATLPLLAEDLGNRDLRSRMARASTQAGLAFSNTKTAIAHSLSYPITLQFHIPHGIACSFSLPLIVSSTAGIGGFCEEGISAIFGTSGAAAAEKISSVLNDLGVTMEFRDYGISPEVFHELIDRAFEGERGQNFIGSKSALLCAAGLGARGQHPAA